MSGPKAKNDVKLLLLMYSNKKKSTHLKAKMIFLSYLFLLFVKLLVSLCTLYGSWYYALHERQLYRISVLN